MLIGNREKRLSSSTWTDMPLPCLLIRRTLESTRSQNPFFPVFLLGYQEVRKVVGQLRKPRAPGPWQLPENPCKEPELGSDYTMLACLRNLLILQHVKRKLWKLNL